MKKLFQRWLLLFVGLAFFFTVGTSYWIHNQLAYRSALHILRLNLDDASRQIDRTQGNVDMIREMAAHVSLAKTRAFAQIIAINPTILNDPSALRKIQEDLDVDELHVSDENGVLIACIPEFYKGYNMASSAQSQAFLPALKDPKFELAQEPRENGSLKILFQYVGVARRDQTGLVQIGYHPKRLAHAMKIADVNNIASLFRIGNNGVLQIEPLKESENVKENIFFKEVNGKMSLCLSIPYKNYLLTGSLPTDEMYLSRNSVIRILIMGNLILFAVIFLLVSVLLQKVVVHGIYSINNSLDKITKGDLNEKINVHTTDEFNALSKGINATVAALKCAIDNEARRIDAELEMGRTIQSAVLPTDFPDNEQYSLSAMMHAAKEVGGDFYDFFEIDDHRLAMIIADVSGKGITAALYMMNAKALMKDLILSGKNPAEVFQETNTELCCNNVAQMFLTAFHAVLDLRTGELTCVNAGHNPPLIKHVDGTTDFLRIKHSLVLGCFKQVQYCNVTHKLNPGEQLLFYTDGVTEAMNFEHEQFGENRLQAFIEKESGTPSEILTNLYATLNVFSEKMPQSDDITAIFLDYHNSLSDINKNIDK